MAQNIPIPMRSEHLLVFDPCTLMWKAQNLAIQYNYLKILPQLL